MRLSILGRRQLEDPAGQRGDERRLEAGVPCQRHRHLLREVAPDHLRRRRGHGLLNVHRDTLLLQQLQLRAVSEPILFPKLRIRFADFPCLHCSIGQRLFTLET